MRRLAVAIRSLIATILRTIDVEGFLLIGGVALLAGVAWTFDWRLAVTGVGVLMVVGAIAWARQPRSP